MDKLMKMLENGEMPNVIELMAALSDISDYWPEAKYEPQEASESTKSSVCRDLYPPRRCAGCE